MPRKLTEADEIYVDTLVTVSIIRTALRAGQPVDPEHLPERLVEIIEANCVRSNMPMVDGRLHYRVDDVIKALDICRGETRGNSSGTLRKPKHRVMLRRSSTGHALHEGRGAVIRFAQYEWQPCGTERPFNRTS
jgi:hypothetical protein